MGAEVTRTHGHGTNGTPTTRHGDWWGKRPGGLRVTIGQKDTKWWKRRQHKIERQLAKRECE